MITAIQFYSMGWPAAIAISIMAISIAVVIVCAVEDLLK